MPMSATFRVGFALGLLVLLGHPLEGDALQDPETPRERVRLEGELKRYHGFINAYQEGNDDGVNEILAWDPERLKRIVAAAETTLDIFRPWDERRVKAAAMLHTDAAMRVLDGDDPRLSFQLGLAARLLHLGDADDVRPFARTWYTTVVGVLRDRAILFVAEGLLERGRAHMPGDPAILYESGVLQEQIATFAAFIRETVTDIPLPRSRSGGLQSLGDTARIPEDRHVTDHRRALEKAAAWLRDTTKADPSSELARLHLGRVQVLRGNFDDGAKLLGQLDASAADSDISYLATMFLGGMHQRRGRHAEAERMYRRATEKVPAAQTAYVALSEVLQKLGRGDESRDVLLGVLRTPAGARTEPWWWYLAEPVGEARKRLDALRASVRR
jgi:tetratricopeptide (TPR) repeat protein